MVVCLKSDEVQLLRVRLVMHSGKVGSDSGIEFHFIVIIRYGTSSYLNKMSSSLYG